MTIQTAGFNEQGLRHVLGLVLDELEDQSDFYFVARAWLGAYDSAPTDESYAGNVPNTFLVGREINRFGDLHPQEVEIFARIATRFM